MADTNGAAMTETDGAALDARGRTTTFLVLETQGELYAVRWALVREAGIVSPQDITVSAERPQVLRNDGGFPLRRLWELVGQNSPGREPEEIAVVFLEENGNRMALAPDRILWKQEAELRRLPQWLGTAPVVAGVIALASGVAVVVVEPFQIKEDECLCRQEQG